MSYVRRASTALILAVALAHGPAVVAGDRAAASTAATRVHIDNFGQVNASYFRGAQPEGRDYRDLAALGVKLVIDLQADGRSEEQGLVEAAGMQFQRIPMTTRTSPTARQISEFLALVNDPKNQPVYVHCAGGRHRTGVMTAVYRMTHDSWTSAQSFKEMKDYKFGADFLHPEFKKFVYAYRVEPQAPALSPGIVATATVPTR